MKTALFVGFAFFCGCNANMQTGVGGGGGDGGGGGGGGGDGSSPFVPSCPGAVPFQGAPISAPANTWTWIPIDGSMCRDGSATGIGVRINPSSTKVLLYLEGGGACFSQISCFGNPGSFDGNAFATWSGRTPNGIFDLTAAGNPFADYSMVYVPYCTGDVHAGANDGADVPGNGPKAQHFVGYANVTRALQRLVPTFANATHVVLSGASAGGFGASFNYDQVAQAFCGANDVTLLDDSGPPFSDTYLAPCLQKRWRDLWNLAATLPAECTACTGPDGGGLVNLAGYYGTKYPNAHFGLISADMDSVIPRFYGYGQNNCAGLDQGKGTMSAAQFQMGLNEMRDNYLSKSPEWGSFFIAATQHTWIGSPNFYTTTAGGTMLSDWVNALANLHTTSNLGM